MVNSKSIQAGAAKPLGKVTEFVDSRSTGGAETEARARRFRLMDVARRCLPANKRLAACMRVPAKGALVVKTMYHPETGGAGFRGLCRCADGKVCAGCAVQLGEKKREELASGVVVVNVTGACYLMTLTTSHKIGDGLADLISRFDQAKREMRQARGYRAALDSWGGSKNVKTVTAWELTWSALNGWHYHQHVLVFVLDATKQQLPADQFAAAARSAWEHAAAKNGLTMNSHGFDWQATRGAIADYVAKFGHEPARRPWGPEDEACKAHAKSGHVVAAALPKSTHLTPFQFLGLLDEGVTQVFGYDLAALFAEYAAATKGKAQLKWSPGLRKALALGAEKTDAELVEETEEGAVCLGVIPAQDWRIVLANDARADLLEQVSSGDFEQERAWLSALGVRYARPLKKRDEAA